MKKDFRYIFKRVIIGILIGLFFIMFKSCNVNALEYIQNAAGVAYFQSQFCEQGEVITDTYDGIAHTGNRFSCSKGPSYKFVQFLNSDNNFISIPAILYEKQLLNNFTFQILFEDSISITQQNRYIGLRAPWVSSNTSNAELTFYDNFLTLNGVKDNNTIYYSPSVSSFVLQPQYCNYSDGSNLYKCNVYLVGDPNISRYVYYIDIPVGTNVSSITLFFGNNNIQSSYDLFTGEISNDFRAMTATVFKKNVSCSANSTNYQCYVSNFSAYSNYSNNNFNVYGSNFFSCAGLIYYRYAPISSFFTPSTRTDNLWLSSTYPNNPVIYNFSNITSNLEEYYNGLITDIEEDLTVSDRDSIENNISEVMGTFADNENSQRYLSTLDALLSYPIQKMQDQGHFDLVNHNAVIGANQIDSKLCWGTDTVIGDQSQPYKVQFFRDYKFTLPCPHSDIYVHLGYGDYGFYPSNFMGANNSGYTYNFISIWLFIQHGLLVYFLFVNVLNIYKYILDSKKSEIEVLEL